MFTRHPDWETEPKLDLVSILVRLRASTLQSDLCYLFSHPFHIICISIVYAGTWYTIGSSASNSEDNLESSLSLSIGSTIVFKAYLVGTESNFISSEQCLAFSTDGSKIACKNRDKMQSRVRSATAKTLLCI